MTPDKFLKLNIVIIAVSFVSFLIFFLVYINKTKKEVRYAMEMYPLLNIECEIHGRVTEIFNLGPDYRIDPNFAYVKINDTIRYRISTLNIPSNYTRLLDVLQVGITIKKDSGSDMLFLYFSNRNDNTVYAFKLVDDDGYPFK